MSTEWELLKTLVPEQVATSRARTADGKVASYIPHLAHAPADALGITLMDTDGQALEAGDTQLLFTMQSISKVFTLLLALMDNGEDAVFSKVGKEPSGDDYNSMLKLELVEPGIPFNPLINAGAIVISSLIKGDTPAAKTARILRFFQQLAADDTLCINEGVYRSEHATAHRNRSLAYFLMDNAVLHPSTSVEEVLDVYFHHCAIQVNTRQLARMALVLALDGQDPVDGSELIPHRYVQIAKTFMTSCGMYNESGSFAIEAGIPAKSGVSGGILAIVPGRYGIGVIGPALNKKGNSTAGLHLLEALSQKLDWSLF